MPVKAKQLKELAAAMPLQKGGTHELFRKLIVAGFFDTPKSTSELIEEIKQTSGTRLKSNVVQTYMRKFMENGIIRSLVDKNQRGNLWVLASEDEVKAAQLTIQSGSPSHGRDARSKNSAAERLSLPSHPLLQTPRCKILFLAADQAGIDHLALDKECREIEQKIQASEHRDGLEFVTKWSVRTKDILQYLNQHRAHVIHFSGHGSSAEELIFLDANDNAKPVSKAALKQLFTTLKDNIRVVVLNACYSRPQAEAIVDVIDCAIGMNRSIGDEAAIVFAAAFYQGIGFGHSVKKAFDSGVTALMLESIPEENTPELLVRKGVDPNTIFLTESAVQTR